VKIAALRLSQHRTLAYLAAESIPAVPPPAPVYPTDAAIEPAAQLVHGRYEGGLRTYSPTGQAYLCPDPRAADGRVVSLAKVFQENGIESRARIDVLIEDRRWVIPAVSLSSRSESVCTAPRATRWAGDVPQSRARCTYGSHPKPSWDA
jgi:hypothetical protein